MLVIIAGLVLALAGFIMVLLLLFQPEFPYFWLLSLVISFLSWVAVLGSRWIYPDPISLENWFLLGRVDSRFLFVVDQISWQYALGLASVLLAVILTTSVDPKEGGEQKSWAGSLILTGVGLIVMLAGNPLTLVFAWSAVDIVEFAIISRSVNGRDLINRTIISFTARLLGIFLVIWAIIQSQMQSDILSFYNISPDIGVYMLLAAGLRLGVIPLHLPYVKEIHLRRGFGTILRLLAPASSLVILARLPATVVQPTLAIYLLIFSALASLYGSIMLLMAPDVLNSRPYWLVALSGMSIASVIRGRPEASIAWGIALLLVGALVFLHTTRRKETRIIAYLAVLGFAGFPYTPSASGWYGLIVLPFNLLDIVYILTHSLVMIGILRLMLKPGVSYEGTERWLQIIYLTGLLVLIISHWVIAIVGWRGSFNISIWWASIASMLITVSYQFLFRNRRGTSDGKDEPIKTRWIEYLWNNIGVRTIDILRLEWLYRFIFWLFSLIQRVLTGFNSLLEGQGGILWTILLMVLVGSLLVEGYWR